MKGHLLSLVDRALGDTAIWLAKRNYCYTIRSATWFEGDSARLIGKKPRLIERDGKSWVGVYVHNHPQRELAHLTRTMEAAVWGLHRWLIRALEGRQI